MQSLQALGVAWIHGLGRIWIVLKLPLHWGSRALLLGHEEVRALDDEGPPLFEVGDALHVLLHEVAALHRGQGQLHGLLLDVGVGVKAHAGGVGGRLLVAPLIWLFGLLLPRLVGRHLLGQLLFELQVMLLAGCEGVGLGASLVLLGYHKEGLLAGPQIH